MPFITSMWSNIIGNLYKSNINNETHICDFNCKYKNWDYNNNTYICNISQKKWKAPRSNNKRRNNQICNEDFDEEENQNFNNQMNVEENNKENMYPDKLKHFKLSN